jgi:hypothetical protein
VRGVSLRSGWGSSGLIALKGPIRAMFFIRWEQGWILVGEIRSRVLMLRDITALLFFYCIYSIIYIYIYIYILCERARACVRACVCVYNIYIYRLTTLEMGTG